MADLLPIGSVVLLKGGTKKVMIYGRKQAQVDNGVVWDYIACLYPEGYIDEKYTFIFNHDGIDRIFFIGYQDEEEIAFEEYLRNFTEAGQVAEAAPAGE